MYHFQKIWFATTNIYQLLNQKPILNQSNKIRAVELIYFSININKSSLFPHSHGHKGGGSDIKSIKNKFAMTNISQFLNQKLIFNQSNKIKADEPTHFSSSINKNSLFSHSHCHKGGGWYLVKAFKTTWAMSTHV